MKYRKKPVEIEAFQFKSYLDYSNGTGQYGVVMQLHQE